METIDRSTPQAVEPPGPEWTFQDDPAGAPAAEASPPGGASSASSSDDDDQGADRGADDTAPPPVPVAEPPAEVDRHWTAFAARGGDDAARVEVSAGQCRVTVHFQRRGASFAEFDRSNAEIRSCALRTARELPAVQSWFAARRELAAHERAAALARARAEECEARRAVLVASGGGPDLAARLKAITEQQRQLLDAAGQAEELAQFAREAVVARHAEAAKEVADAYRMATAGVMMAARRREQAALDRVVEAVAQWLDELAAAQLSRQGVGMMMSVDRGGLARQLMGELEAEADRLAMTPPPPAPAA